MTKAIENFPKGCSFAARFTGDVLEADCKAGEAPSAAKEKPGVGDRSEKKERTAMTKEKRLGFLILLQSLISHPYGAVFDDINMLRDCRPESFARLAKPLDLKIVESKLEKNLYFTIEAFLEDVRTIFSNAMEIFPATEDVHKMAVKLREQFESGVKMKAESLDPEPKTLNDVVVSEKNATQGEKNNSSSRKRKWPPVSSGSEKMYVGGRDTASKDSRVLFSGSRLVKGKEENSSDISVGSTGTNKSPAAMSPRRAAIVSLLLERYSGTIMKAQKELGLVPMDSGRKKEEKVAPARKLLSASGTRMRGGEKEAHLKVKEESKREREAPVQDQRRREREALERMQNTAHFGADHEALREFERIIGHPRSTMTDHSSGGDEEIEEGEIR